jgi:hypothetical protein
MVINGLSSSLEEVLMTTRRGMITTQLLQRHDDRDNEMIIHVCTFLMSTSIFPLLSPLLTTAARPVFSCIRHRR